MKYLQLIKTITLLHQYQREIKTVQHNGEALEYVEVAIDDIATANRLAHDVLGRSLDELPPQTRKLLEMIVDHVQSACQLENLRQTDYRFSRKWLRDAVGWGDTQLKIHLARLTELEYLIAHNTGKGKTYQYELLYAGEGENSSRFLMNLIDVENLSYDTKWSGQKGEWSGSGRPLVGGQSGVGRVDENAENAIYTVSNPKTLEINEKRTSAPEKHPSSCRTYTTSSLAAKRV